MPVEAPSHRSPIFIEALLDDPAFLRQMVERNAPYLPVQRYFASDAEYHSSSGTGQTMIIAPNFRGDWAYEKPLVAGAEVFLGHELLQRAAGQLFDTDCIRPFAVFANLTWQLPFDQGAGHTDVPAFRGIERKKHPIWLLGMMGHSGLFEAERIRIATAVAWFYEGDDGGFEYWPDGPEAPSVIHEGDIFNTAVMGDNDRMFHRVRPTGRLEDGLLSGMSLETQLDYIGGAVGGAIGGAGREDWRICDGDETRASLTYDRLRISVSWKAIAFRDPLERQMVDEHSDDISIDEVWRRFYADLDERAIPYTRPADPLRDPGFIDLLSSTYRKEPVAA